MTEAYFAYSSSRKSINTVFLPLPSAQMIRGLRKTINKASFAYFSSRSVNEKEAEYQLF